MSDDTVDPELQALRERRLKEILTRPSAPVEPPRTATAKKPTELTSGSVNGFLQSNRRVVVDVWAPWCGPCRTMAPILDTLARELDPDVQFAKVNADNEPNLAARWGVEGIPTLLLFEGGKLVDRVVGAYPHDALLQHLRSVYRLGAGAVPPVGT